MIYIPTGYKKSQRRTFLKGFIPQGLSTCSGWPVMTRRPAGSDWTRTCIHQWMWSSTPSLKLKKISLSNYVKFLSVPQLWQMGQGCTYQKEVGSYKILLNMPELVIRLCICPITKRQRVVHFCNENRKDYHAHGKQATSMDCKHPLFGDFPSKIWRAYGYKQYYLSMVSKKCKISMAITMIILK